MILRTPTDFGAFVREQRRLSGLSQAGLADLVGVNRKWIIGVEQGRARAELGLVLRVFNALNIKLNASKSEVWSRPASVPSVNIDDIIDAAQKK